ncbi:hypothetical protein ACFPRL_31380 [Pseudoclavibacter helvolus]
MRRAGAIIVECHNAPSQIPTGRTSRRRSGSQATGALTSPRPSTAPPRSSRA